MEKGIVEKLTSHICFIVDYLNVFPLNMNSMKLLFDLVSQLSKNIGMKFWESQCAYLQIERGRIKVNSENNLNIQQVKEGESYKYLGIDENISFDGTTNMERVLTQYFKRVCKIWSSGLSGYKKIHILQCICSYCTDTNFGLLVWTIDEIDSFDKKNKKNSHYDQ